MSLFPLCLSLSVCVCLALFFLSGFLLLSPSPIAPPPPLNLWQCHLRPSNVPANSAVRDAEPGDGAAPPQSLPGTGRLPHPGPATATIECEGMYAARYM